MQMVRDTRQYSYVGSNAVLNAVHASAQRFQIQRAADVLHWIKGTKQILERDKTIVVTFIVDLAGNLWIADQRSEHVACAGGEKVLSAGEMTFQVLEQNIEVIEITNQSAGYCPEPESWPVVEAALTKSRLPHP